MLRDEGVLAAETVHIGDSWNCDVLGATAAGLRAIWISSQPMPHRSPEGLVGVAPDFPAAVALLRQEDRDRPR
jgi:FMN phosphatase YigB (HAD superfamily)